jgi:hypothetical protein
LHSPAKPAAGYAAPARATAATGRPARGGGPGGPAADARAIPRHAAPTSSFATSRPARALHRHVSEFGFNKSGRYLALVIDAAEQIGNGIQIHDTQTGVTPLETNPLFYERMAWTEEGDALIAFKQGRSPVPRAALQHRRYTGFHPARRRSAAYEPSEDKAFRPNTASAIARRSGTKRATRSSSAFRN